MTADLLTRAREWLKDYQDDADHDIEDFRRTHDLIRELSALLEQREASHEMPNPRQPLTLDDAPLCDHYVSHPQTRCVCGLVEVTWKSPLSATYSTNIELVVGRVPPG